MSATPTTLVASTTMTTASSLATRPTRPPSVNTGVSMSPHTVGTPAHSLAVVSTPSSNFQSAYFAAPLPPAAPTSTSQAATSTHSAMSIVSSSASTSAVSTSLTTTPSSTASISSTATTQSSATTAPAPHPFSAESLFQPSKSKFYFEISNFKDPHYKK